MLDDESMPKLLQHMYYNSYLWLDYPDEDRENPPPNVDRIAEPIQFLYHQIQNVGPIQFKKGEQLRIKNYETSLKKFKSMQSCFHDYNPQPINNIVATEQLIQMAVNICGKYCQQPGFELNF